MGDDDAFGGSIHNQVYACITLVTSILGLAASFFTILLIHRMRTPTGYTSHVLLVLIMSYFQFLYDLTFFFRMVNCGYYIFVVSNFFQIWTSTAASFVSNWISIIALLIVVFRKKFDANKYFGSILASSMLPSLFIGLLYLGSVIPQDRKNHDGEIGSEKLFYYIRLLLIFVNFLFCGIIIYQVEQISGHSKKPSPQEIAIKLLSRRMIFYPIIQALGRLCFSVYEQIYGFDTSGATSNPTQYGWLLSVAIITPFVSVGYLFIFLVMQPEAKRQFVDLLLIRPINNSLAPNNTRASKMRATQQIRQQQNLKESSDGRPKEARSTSLLSRTGNYSTTTIQQRVINFSAEEDYYDDDDDEALLSALDKVINDVRQHSSTAHTGAAMGDAESGEFNHSHYHRNSEQDDSEDRQSQQSRRPSRILANSLMNMYNSAVGTRPSSVSRTSVSNPITVNNK